MFTSSLFISCSAQKNSKCMLYQTKHFSEKLEVQMHPEYSTGFAACQERKLQYFILCFQKSPARKMSSRKVVFKVCLWNNSGGTAWECAGNAHSQAPPQTYQIRHSQVRSSNLCLNETSRGFLYALTVNGDHCLRFVMFRMIFTRWRKYCVTQDVSPSFLILAWMLTE